MSSQGNGMDQGQEAPQQQVVPKVIPVDMAYLENVERRLLEEKAKWEAQYSNFSMNNEASLELVRLAKQGFQQESDAKG